MLVRATSIIVGLVLVRLVVIIIVAASTIAWRSPSAPASGDSSLRPRSGAELGGR